MIYFDMIHFLIIFAVILITSTFILIKIFRGGKQSAWITIPSTIFAILFFALPFVPQPRFSISHTTVIVLTLELQEKSWHVFAKDRR